MHKLLFVDGCIRGAEKSRTYKLARAYIEARRAHLPDLEEQLVNLNELSPRCFDREMLERRDALEAAGTLDDLSFALARQFAAADEVVLAAPYWDMGYPALVKAYLEHVCVNGLTFGYGENGRPMGLCKATRMTYVVTGGGAIDPNADSGAFLRHLRVLAIMLGIDNFEVVYAEKLDIQGLDAALLVEQACDRARTLACQ